MQILRSLLLAGALAGATGSVATAQTGQATPLAGLVSNATVFMPAVSNMKQIPNPATMVALRGGAMITPRGAGLVGIDATIPGLGSLVSSKVRIDADAIFKANLAGVNTIFPVTADVIFTAPHVGVGPTFYVGGGAGAVFGGGTHFDGKVLAGADLTAKFGAEANLHFTSHDTLFTLVGRFHL